MGDSGDPVTDAVPPGEGGPSREIFVQASCPSDLFLSLCDKLGIDRAAVMERHGLDGDPYDLALAMAATAQAVAVITAMIRELLRARHPIKLVVKTVEPDGASKEDRIAGVSADDLPAIEAFVSSLRDSHRGFDENLR
jgi:hypothetical protein